MKRLKLTPAFAAARSIRPFSLSLSRMGRILFSPVRGRRERFTPKADFLLLFPLVIRAPPYISGWCADGNKTGSRNQFELYGEVAYLLETITIPSCERKSF